MRRLWGEPGGWLRPVLAQAQVAPDNTPSYAVRVLVAVLGRVRESRPEVLRMRKLELLEDDAQHRIANGVRTATDLKDRQAAMAARIDLDAAIRVDAATLEEHATSIAEAGFLGRLFSAKVKLRLRGAQSLCLGEPAKVEEISFSASERSGEAISITADDVRTRVGELAKNADLTKLIL